MGFLTWENLRTVRERSGWRSASFEASGGARLRQEFARRLLCNRQWPLDSELSCESTHALFGRAGMPVRVGKMTPAIPLATALAILLSAMVARLIHARNCLAELFFGFYGCCVHRNLQGTKIAAPGKGILSVRVPLRRLCSRRYTQYTPGRQKSPPYFAPSRRRTEYSRAQISPSGDRSSPSCSSQTRRKWGRPCC